ncbi:MAG: Zn-dependent protease with chaperone function, partial [Symploca sp. SIO2B6]|nr:Zn-dependent protease with chaperone function [Symploca sp. SIO2B6]
ITLWGRDRCHFMACGVMAEQFNWYAFRWLEFDSDSVFWGMLALGFSCGTIIRINTFFPDIKPSKKEERELTEVLTDPHPLPADAQIIQLEGKLLGRRGTSNWLNQDLILQTQTGLIRLHSTSVLGNVGHLIFDALRLQPLKGRTVVVSGWLRRGTTPWIDIDTIKPQRGKPIQCGHPMWSTLLACLAALWGAYIIS